MGAAGADQPRRLQFKYYYKLISFVLLPVFLLTSHSIDSNSVKTVVLCVGVCRGKMKHIRKISVLVSAAVSSQAGSRAQLPGSVLLEMLLLTRQRRTGRGGLQLAQLNINIIQSPSVLMTTWLVVLIQKT